MTGTSGTSSNDDGGERFGGFEIDGVAAVGDDLQAGVGQGLDVGVGALQRHHRVVVTPDDEGWEP